jgi:hypothetical protein
MEYLQTIPEELRQQIYTNLFNSCEIHLNKPTPRSLLEPPIAGIPALREGALEAFYSSAICCV